MSGLIADLHVKFEVDPPELEPILTNVIIASVAKGMAVCLHKPWSDWQESELQEQISKLVTEAMNRSLRTIRQIIVKRDGQRITREFDIAKIESERALQ